MPKAYGYCRLSKKEITVTCSACRMEWTFDFQDAEQTEFDCPHCGKSVTFRKSNPISIEAQVDKIVDLANTRVPRNVDPDVDFFTDINVSGSIPVRDRPDGAKLFAMLRSGDWLIVSKLDRLFRDLEDCCKQVKFFQKNDIHLLMGDLPEVDINQSTGELFMKIIAIVAEWERKRISERTKEGMAKRKEQGKPISQETPRGYALKCTLCQHVYAYSETVKGRSCPACKHPRRGNTEFIPDRNEQTIMWRILWERSPYMWKDWDLVVNGLNEDGIRTRQNKLIYQRWCENYFGDACMLLAQGKLLEDCRPAKMENFSIHKIPNIPKRVREYLEQRSREEAAKNVSR